MATINSGRSFFILLTTSGRTFGCGLALFCLLGKASADSNALAGRAEMAFAAAQTASRQDSNSVPALNQTARAAFEWAEFAQRDEQRESIALAGILSARRAVKLEPTNSATHYWLAMNLGQLARTKTLGALKLVREMEDEFTQARNLDPLTDYAGPDRSLGLLYRDAPGWPTSVGSKKKAREHLEAAAKLHPDFPDNPLALLESYDEWGERQNFERQLKVTEQVMLASASRFTGPDWESSRLDWDKRFAQLKSRAGKVGRYTPVKGHK